MGQSNSTLSKKSFSKVVVPELNALPLVRIPALFEHREINLDLIRRTPVQEVQNHDETNAKKLSVVTRDLWMDVLSCLYPNDMLTLMIVCKFLLDQTNEPQTRARLQIYKDHQALSRIYQEPRMFSRASELRLPNNLGPIDQTVAESELYQPGDNGFIMM